ncbi:hypothetical protein BDV93DRAFT_526918 [Ceratobasidium sp. AG-I]|nr:hypothetical protein BDV93DRAFT_526918 [Ceratobasidium sp. AG-I]
MFTLLLKPSFPGNLTLLSTWAWLPYCAGLECIESFSSHLANLVLVRPTDMTAIRANPSIIVEVQNDALDRSDARTEALGDRPEFRVQTFHPTQIEVPPL